MVTEHEQNNPLYHIARHYTPTSLLAELPQDIAVQAAMYVGLCTGLDIAHVDPEYAAQLRATRPNPLAATRIRQQVAAIREKCPAPAVNWPVQESASADGTTPVLNRACAYGRVTCTNLPTVETKDGILCTIHYAEYIQRLHADRDLG